MNKNYLSVSAVRILSFHFWYNTDIPALNISQPQLSIQYQRATDDTYFHDWFCDVEC